MNWINWYKNQLLKIKRIAGPRYTPDLNIELPISEIFEGISRTETFYAEIREYYGKLIREFKYVTSKYDNTELQAAYDNTKTGFDKLVAFLDQIKEYTTNSISWEQINQSSNTLNSMLQNFNRLLREARELLAEDKKSNSKDGKYKPSLSERYNSYINDIYETQQIVQFFEDLSSSLKAKLSNNPFLLLTGSAGTGKTHLLCDVVERRTKDDSKILPTFMVFGEYFYNEKNVWSQVIKQLKLTTEIKNKDEFLRQLDQLGLDAKSRSLLIIDALNENITHSPNFWKNNLNELIKEVKKYPNIALIVSIRSGFEKAVLNEKQKKFFIQVEHHGFVFREWEAITKFFNVFSLPLPEIPLLMPEFQNPLFLLLFCKAFQHQRNRQIFRGHEGATYIFENYVDKISKKIEREFNINSGPGKNIWDTVIEKIAEEMVNNKDDKISEAKGMYIIKQAHQNVNSKKLLQALERNMLIVKVPRYLKGERVNGFDIRFPFQKFSDHLIGRYIFKKYEKEFGKSNKNIMTAKKFFSRRRKLGKFLAKSWNIGIIETLSIQSPEHLKGIEFIEVAPYLIKDVNLSQIAERAFIESLIWRNPKAFSKDRKNTLKIINKNIIKRRYEFEQLLNAFLSVAPIPSHPFNAERLHQHLCKFSMPERDSWWSTFLHYQSGGRDAVDRLLNWAWSDQDKSHISDESIFLTSIALSWFLTTSNRFVRDKATKGLVVILQNRIPLIIKLLDKFKDINDLYVLERLYAVAYGCVLRNQEDSKDIEKLALWIYKHIFKDDKLPVHILLRDYARGIIEVALRRGIKLNIDESKINPPYKSEWPKNIPSEKELKARYYPEDFFQHKTEERGFLDIWSSVMYNFGQLADFGRYILNSHLSAWTGKKIGESVVDREKLFKAFLDTLSAKQKRLWEETNPIIYEENIGKENILTPKIIISCRIAKGRKSNKELQVAVRAFKKSLKSKQKKIYENEIEPFLDHNQNIYNPVKDFDAGLAQRWIFNRVVELGYDPKLHGQFDKEVNVNFIERIGHKAERIGKKYQWIALHEFMALVSDHFEFKGYSWSDSNKEYKGPWQPDIRDIDPSFILQNDYSIKQIANFSQWRSTHGFYNAWKKHASNLNWLKTKIDLPNPENIITITDDKGKEWLMFQGSVNWKEKTPPENREYDIPARELWYELRSYIVKRKDAEKFFSWAKKQDFIGNWMPHSNDFYEVFLGEYPNSTAFNDLRDDYNIWTSKGNVDIRIPVIVTDDSYLNEFTLDCSHKGSISVKLLCKWLINKMSLLHKSVDGIFYNMESQIIVFPTSIFDEKLPCLLLIDKQALINFCIRNKYIIFWTLVGEKQIIGGDQFKNNALGRLSISGIYRISSASNIEGEYYCKFIK